MLPNCHNLWDVLIIEIYVCLFNVIIIKTNFDP